MPVPPIKPTAIGVYVFRRAAVESTSADTRPPPTAAAPTDIFPPVEILQIHRSLKANGHQHSWQTVYGGIEPGETALQAALRELREETSLTPLRMFQVEYLENFYFRHSDSLLIMPVFAVEVAADAVPVLNHEHDAYRWVAEGDVKTAFMWRTQREALRIMLEMLREDSAAMRFLTILPREN